jgi:hypothetical protein
MKFVAFENGIAIRRHMEASLEARDPADDIE